jgi:hypothetical protein
MYYNDKIEKAKDSPKGLQKIFNTLLHKGRDCKLPTSSSPEALANTFAGFFMDKVENICANLPTPTTQPLVPQPVDCPPGLAQFVPVETSVVQKIIMQSPTKSCPLDPMTTWLLKEVSADLVPFITRLINESLGTGCVPDSLKCSLITPIIKKSSLDPRGPSKLSISNLSFVSKVLERVVASQLNKYISDNNLHDIFQSAYKACHSTETALLRVTNDIRCMLDDRSAAWY